jgi:hypothetical protein
MSKVTTVKEAVKESLVGAEQPTELSSQTKARFNKHAKKDELSGEHFLGPEEFIDAVAPIDEDFVSAPSLSLHGRHPLNFASGALSLTLGCPADSIR